MANDPAGAADTFPKLLIHNAAVRGGRISMRHKDFGIWQTWTWAQVLDEVRAFSVGLEELGLKRGDKFAIVGANRPRLYWAMCAAQALGAVPVPIYADSVADEMAYVLEHAEVTVAVVENQEQVDKMLSIADRLPKLRHMIYDEPRGLRDYDRASCPGSTMCRRSGARSSRSDPARLAAWEASVAQGKGADLAVILYTSGTTGRPKGVMLTYDNIIVSARNGNLFDSARREGRDDRLSAARLGRRPRVLLRAALCRGLLRQLPGGAARRWWRTGARSARPMPSRRRASTRTC